MTHTNDFKAFAAGGGANVIDQATFAALTTLIANGFTGGIAQSNQLNKVWRQASVVASMIGSFINDQGYDALDNGDLATLLAHFEAALVALIASNAPKSMVYCGTSTGSANVQVLTPSPAITAYGTGVPSYIFIAGYTNTGAATINISGLGAVSIYHDTESGPVALTGGEILAGSMCLLRYDGTHMRLEDSQLGTAALQNSSVGTPGGVVASVSGATTVGHIATFTDTNGTIGDGGAIAVLGTAAAKAASDNSKATLASVSAAPTANHIAKFTDTAGTVGDGGVLGSAANKNEGHTVADPGTGALEIAAPFVGGASATTGNTRTFAATDNGKVVRRSNSGAAMTDTLPGSSPGILAAGWFTTILNSDPLASLTIAADAGSTVTGQVIIPPGRSIVINSDGAGYWTEGGIGRIQLQGNITLYVATTGSDTANTGLTVGSPFATIQKAWNVLQAGYDLSGFVGTIQIADGTYAAGLTVKGQITGASSYTSVVINGNAASPANVVIQAAMLGQWYPAFLVQNCKLTSAYGLNSQYQAVIGFANVIFAGTGGAHIIAVDGGRVISAGNYSIIAGATNHLSAYNGGKISINGAVVTLTGTPAFGNYAACSDQGTIVVGGGTSFVGSATGARYNVTSLGEINTAGAGASFLPGNAAGTATSPGIYV